jgi:hypothetical protein
MGVIDCAFDYSTEATDGNFGLKGIDFVVVFKGLVLRTWEVLEEEEVIEIWGIEFA